MPELPYPTYTISANGPNETGFVIVLHLEDGAGGPLPDMTDTGVVGYLRDHLATQDSTSVQLTRNDISATNL